MNAVTANELKTKGISALEANLRHNEEVIISVRGQARYVVLELDKYTKLREYELIAALHETKSEIAAGRFHIETVDEHIARVTNGVNDGV